jgi:hypothetical protein
MAHAGGEDPDPDLTSSRLRKVEFLDGHRLAGRPQDRGPDGCHVSVARRRSTGRAASYGT